ncbi:MAG: hypothetical protein ACR2JS_09585 [Candidatus Nanopelagicales bacterium]
MQVRLRALALTAASVVLAASLAGCSSSSTSSASSMSETSSSPVTASTPVSEGSTFGEPTGLWDIPRDVQAAYFTAICMAPATKFGYAGTFNQATGKCLTSNDMESDVDFVMRRILASDAEQMRQSTQFMVTQVGVPVEGCPTLEEYNTVADLTVTNECVIAAMKALTAYLSN